MRAVALIDEAKGFLAEALTHIHVGYLFLSAVDHGENESLNCQQWIQDREQCDIPHMHCMQRRLSELTVNLEAWAISVMNYFD